jgi:hypothetical protein
MILGEDKNIFDSLLELVLLGSFMPIETSIALGRLIWGRMPLLNEFDCSSVRLLDFLERLFWFTDVTHCP